MGQPKKDNSKRDQGVLRAICSILAENRIPSLRDAAKESGYTNPSTYVSMVSLHNQGLLSRIQLGGNVVYLPPNVATAMRDKAVELLTGME